MKVDMSPEGVSARLNTMGQLWDLSVALLQSRSINGAEMRPSRWRIATIQDSIRKVLIDDWDPIGVRGVREAVGEYDSYIGRIYQILARSRSLDDLADCLAQIETEEIGVVTSVGVRTQVAEKLLALNFKLGQIS